VFKSGGPFKSLRELARTHRMVVADVVRTKNRIKSVYRSRGVPVAGKSVYSSAGREQWQEQLPEAYRGPLLTLYAELDALEEVRSDAEKALVQEARKFPITKLLATCPGLGAIRAAQLVPIVVSPHRFRTKRQFWSYCGLGIVMRSTSDWLRDKNGQWQRAQVQQTRGLNLTHNHHLKAIFKGAATTVITQHPDEPLNAAHQRWLAAGNIGRTSAYLRVRHQASKCPIRAFTSTSPYTRGIMSISKKMWQGQYWSRVCLVVLGLCGGTCRGAQP
jgi:transposase